MLHKLITSVKFPHLTDSTRQKSQSAVIATAVRVKFQLTNSRNTRVMEEDNQMLIQSQEKRRFVILHHFQHFTQYKLEKYTRHNIKPLVKNTNYEWLN